MYNFNTIIFPFKTSFNLSSDADDSKMTLELKRTGRVKMGWNLLTRIYLYKLNLKKFNL